MVKPDYSRDYYADLELPGPAEAAEVKKQFKKLALKYHPDRNPGKEDQAKEKFVVIQTAHEILADPATKAKYDANRKRTSYPAASGVRGNPYQNVARDVNDIWGAPPKRKPAPTRPMPTPYSNWGVPQQPKPKPTDDPGSLRDHLRAWDRMRTSSSRQTPTTGTTGSSSAKPTPPQTKPNPPPPPPRTAYQARQQEASFGASKKAYAQPQPSPVADEPPAKNQHYTSSHSSNNIFAQSAAANAAKNQRPATVQVDPLSEQFSETFLDNRQRTPYASHVGEKLNPFEGATPTRAKSVREQWQQAQESDEEAPPRAQRQRSASVDGMRQQQSETKPFPYPSYPNPNHNFPSQASARYSPRPTDLNATNDNPFTNTTPATPTGSASNMAGNGEASKKNGPNVFTVPDDDDDHIQPSPATARFMRNSTDSINTRFVAEEAGGKYEFSAGGVSVDGSYKDKLRPRNRGRQSPKRPAFPHSASEPPSSEPQAQSQAQAQPQQQTPQKPFNPKDYEIGPEHFVPPPFVRQATSPTRHGSRTKKPKPVKMTAGTAGMVDDDETSSEERLRPTPTEPPNSAPSPMAMDIDSPPPGPTIPPPPPGARSVNVEPSKPEWRAGDVNGAKPEVKLGSSINVAKVPSGSEDTDDFSTRTMFSEFKNTEPFAPKTFGLGTWNDLKSTLPFESKASSKLHLDSEKPKPAPVDFPHPPVAPRPPPALAIKDLKPSVQSWATYVREFEYYLQEWTAFDKRIAEHFMQRQRVGEEKGDKRFSFINARGDAGMQQYMRDMEQDKFIRQKWIAACEAHELRMKEFMKHREKMKATILEAS